MRSFLKNKIHLSIAVFFAASMALGATYFDDVRAVTLGVGSNSIHSSNIFEVTSTTKSAKPCPAMTSTQRDAISSPQSGACIYNTTDGILNYYNGSIWGPISNPSSVLGPVSATDEAVARFDLTTGKIIQNSVVTITDAGVTSGVTQLNVDNIRVDGNTISSQDTNGPINLEPNGSGEVVSTKTIKGAVIQSTGDLIVAGEWQGAVTTDSSTTGANATLANPASLLISLTNNSLTSITNITSGASTFAIITNKTGGILTIKENTGGTAGYRILTGTGGDIEIENNASFLATYIGGSVNRWHVVGGTGSGSGGPPPQQFTTKNTYNFESSVGNWLLYKDAAASAPVDCTAGTSSGDFLFSRETAAPLVGRGSGYINALNLANTQGEGVSALSDTIPSVYQGRPLELEFDYYSFGSYASGDFAVYAYDVTNGALLNAGVSLGSLNVGYNKFHSLVYPSANTASVRICIHNTTTATTLKNLHFDEVRLKLAESVSVPLVSTLTTVPTINNFGTVTNAAFNWTIVGDRAIGNGRWTNGTVAAGTASFTLPNGWTSNVPGSDLYACGRWERGVSAATTVKNGTLMCQTGNGTIFLTQDDYTTASAPGSGANANVIAANSNTMYVWFSIPISQLSQNTTTGLAQQSLLSYSSSSSGGLVAFPTSANLYGDAASFVLKGGRKYKVTYQLLFVNAGVITSTGIRYGVSTSSGNAFADAENGLNFARGFINTASGASTFAPIEVTLSPTTDTTYYLKQRVDGSTTNVGYSFGYTVEELAYSNTSINTGPIFLGTEAWNDNEGNATTSVRVYKNGPFKRFYGLTTVTGSIGGSGDFNITIPSQHACLSAAYPSVNSVRPKIGVAACSDSGANYGCSAHLTSTTNIRVYGTNSGALGNITTTNPFTWATGDYISFDVSCIVE